ncbi:MAG: hypothetical protein KDE26_15510 [Bacteroidetes bacterium]|nr:hypothetical protein [Bacteroidota bacterium]MCB0844661.1 hypothetical protein [Bacteroidota bacterium]
MNKSNLFFTAFFIGSLLWMSCSSSQTGATSESDATQNQADVATVDTLTELFPVVYTGENYSNLFEAYTMKFKLTYEPPLLPMTNPNVPWVNPEAFDENNGSFITYIRNGRELSLSNPYIQVQYINKALECCTTTDLMYQSLDNILVGQKEGKITKEKFPLQTAAGLTAICQEYRTPDLDTGERKIAGKYMAYGYVEYDQDYIIGFALTTTTKADYDANLPMFYSIVQSLEYN